MFASNLCHVSPLQRTPLGVRCIFSEHMENLP